MSFTDHPYNLDFNGYGAPFQDGPDRRSPSLTSPYPQDLAAPKTLREPRTRRDFPTQSPASFDPRYQNRQETRFPATQQQSPLDFDGESQFGYQTQPLDAFHVDVNPLHQPTIAPSNSDPNFLQTWEETQRIAVGFGIIPPADTNTFAAAPVAEDAIDPALWAQNTSTAAPRFQETDQVTSSRNQTPGFDDSGIELAAQFEESTLQWQDTPANNGYLATQNPPSLSHMNQGGVQDYLSSHAAPTDPLDAFLLSIHQGTGLPAWANIWRDRAYRDEAVRWLSQPEAEKGTYRSLLVSRPAVVAEWKQAGIAAEDISRLLQYYIIIVQVFGPETRDEILKLRHTAPYHDLDHRNVFAEHGSIPNDGWCPKITYRHQIRRRPQPMYQKNCKHFELVDYASICEPLPIGTTDADILTRYPNHMKFEFLESFFQNKVSGGQMYRGINHRAFDLYKSTGVNTSQSEENFVYTRKRNGKDDTKAAMKSVFHGATDAQIEVAFANFVNSPIKIRPRGDIPILRTTAASSKKKNAAKTTCAAKKKASTRARATQQAAMSRHNAPPPAPQQMPLPECDYFDFSLPPPGVVHGGWAGSKRDDPIDLTSDETPDDESIATPADPILEGPVQILSEAISPSAETCQINEGTSGGGATQPPEATGFLDEADYAKFLIAEAENAEHLQAMGSAQAEDMLMAHAIRLLVTIDHPEATLLKDARSIKGLRELTDELGKSFQAYLIQHAGSLSLADHERIAGYSEVEALEILIMALDNRRQQWDEENGGEAPPSADEAAVIGGRREFAEDAANSSVLASTVDVQSHQQLGGIDTAAAPTPNIEVPPKGTTKQQPNIDNSSYETPLQQGRPTSKRTREEMEAEDNRPSGPTMHRPQKAKKIAATKTSAYSALHLNPPSAQDPQKRSFDSVEYDPNEPVLPVAKKMRPTVDAGISFNAEPTEAVEPQVQIEEPQQHVAMPEPMVQPDVPLSYEESMPQQHTTDCTIPTLHDTFFYGPPMMSETESAVQQADHNPFAEDEQLFPDSLMDLPQVAGGDEFDEEAFEQFLQEQCLGLNGT